LRAEGDHAVPASKLVHAGADLFDDARDLLPGRVRGGRLDLVLAESEERVDVADAACRDTNEHMSRSHTGPLYLSEPVGIERVQTVAPNCAHRSLPQLRLAAGLRRCCSGPALSLHFLLTISYLMVSHHR
jgi:hypothetical protein